MKKNYILDTNVLLHDPAAFASFEDNTVVIPLGVIEEIDRFKRDQSELGRNARAVSRRLDELRARGKLSAGVLLDGGGTLRIAFNGSTLRGGAQPLVDDSILQLAVELTRDDTDHPCVVVSKDINLRLRADAIGVMAEDYETDRVAVGELYSGNREASLDAATMEAFARDGGVPFEGEGWSPNEYAMLRDPASDARTVLARFDAEERRLVPLIRSPEEIQPISPRNREQCYAMDALLNDHIKVVTIIGKAGTGKTLLAVAAGMHKTFDRRTYRRMLICRPTVPMGRDIGYLPGTVEEKLNPWMQPIYDALDLLANGKRSGLLRARDGFEQTEKLGVEPLTYIRGRSIPNQYLIVDEAQNLTPTEVKTVMTRVGPGTKIVLTGDIYQIDNPYVDSMSNGLTHVAQKFRPHALAAHILLTKGVRSEVAELAANIL